MRTPIRVAPRIAGLPDRGSLLAYDRGTPAIRRGAYTLHPVQLSETHALRAIAEGGMVIPAPDGEPIQLVYERHVEHADGSWSWIGRLAGQGQGDDAILTFGARAVFGSIPDRGHAPLQIATAGGRTWLVQTDARLEAEAAAQQAEPVAPDFLPAPRVVAAAAAQAARAATQATSANARTAAQGPATTAVVDLVIGYTSGFAQRLGGQSQALTRLNFLVQVANEAYANSQVNGQLRLVRTVQIDYPDNTSNQATLFALSGVQCSSDAGGSLHVPTGAVSCTAAERPSALQRLIDARDESGADIAALVRNYSNPENGSCGASWLLGGGQTPLDASSADFALSVISDSNGNAFPSNSNTCRNEYLAHETGHVMGLQHDRANAAGLDDDNDDNNPLDPDEFGRFPYSFGYNTGVDAGNFATVMAIRATGQASYRVFSNPRITFCGGFACGVVDQADNARALEQTMPIVAAFRTPTAARNDFDGDGRSDLLWRNLSTGANAIWKSANSATPQSVVALATSWKAAGAGDFNGDGRADLLWRNANTGANAIWLSGNYATSQAVTGVANTSFVIAGIGDFNGDGRADILWRNNVSGANAIWLSANASTPQAIVALPTSWKVAGVGDFNADGRSDIVWRNSSTGANAIWLSGNVSTSQAVAGVGNQSFVVAGVADFDGDGRADILWRNISNGVNTIWRSGNFATSQAVSSVAVAWKVAAVGDYDGDGRGDILWRNGSTGANAIWKSGNVATSQAVTGVTNLAWAVIP
jgi:hypothetical protein